MGGEAGGRYFESGGRVREAESGRAVGVPGVDPRLAVPRAALGVRELVAVGSREEADESAQGHECLVPGAPEVIRGWEGPSLCHGDAVGPVFDDEDGESR